MIQSVFVYGTLKRGQCRADLWPIAPIRIRTAWTRGTLFSRPDYPAMIEGRDRVCGECWDFNLESMDTVLKRLDEIEGANQPGERDLYRRLVIDIFGVDDSAAGRAYGYHYASDPNDDGFVRLIPTSPDELVTWPEIGKTDREHKNR